MGPPQMNGHQSPMQRQGVGQAPMMGRKPPMTKGNGQQQQQQQQMMMNGSPHRNGGQVASNPPVQRTHAQHGPFSVEENATSQSVQSAQGQSPQQVQGQRRRGPIQNNQNAMDQDM